MPSRDLLIWAITGIWRMWKPNRTVNLKLHINAGTPTTGHWCEKCRLPSAVNFPMSLLTEDGVYPATTATACTECHPELFEEE